MLLSNLVLNLVGIQHGDGIAIGNIHNPPRDPDRDRLGMGSAGQRQQHGRDYLSQCIHTHALVVSASASNKERGKLFMDVFSLV